MRCMRMVLYRHFGVDNMAAQDMVLVGTIVKPHGLRGELCVESYADSPLLFDDVPALFLRLKKARPKRFKVTGLRMHKGRPLLFLDGVRGRNEAEELRGAEVLVRRKDIPEPDEESFLLVDIIGCDVVLEDGTRLGIIEDVMTTPSEIWLIRAPDKREVLFPAEPEFVPEVDLDAKQVVISPPEGLLDLYLPDSDTSDEPDSKEDT